MKFLNTGKIKYLELSNDYTKTKTKKGYEEYTFKGVKVTAENNKTYIFYNGDVCSIPIEGYLGYVKFIGLEINFYPTKEIEGIFMLANKMYKVEDLKDQFPEVYKEMIAIKIDQETGKMTNVYQKLEKERVICDKVSQIIFKMYRTYAWKTMKMTMTFLLSLNTQLKGSEMLNSYQLFHLRRSKGKY